MSDTNIEILGEETVTCDNGIVVLPTNFISVGDVENNSLKVYIKQDVYKRIEKYSKEQMSKEVGSILIGEYLEEKNKITVIISDYIEAKFTDATASTLTFTHETWDYIYKEKEKKYPDKKIVGWQHTHPGYGIFLSNYDMFIQENFFNLPWQTAYVVDPIADKRGFFEWKGENVCKSTGFYVYDEIGKEIKISEKAKPVKKNVSYSTLLLSFLLVVSMLVSVSLWTEKNSISQKLNETINEFNQKPVHIPQEPSYDTETFKVHLVKEGDNIENICQEYGLDYMSNIGKIIKINNLDDVNKILAGQKLYLPLE